MDRIARSSEDLIESLAQHLAILKNAIDKVQAGDFGFVKSITGELRVLVYKGRTNKPLLSALAEMYKITPIIKTDGHRGIQKRPLATFLNEQAFASGTEKIDLKNVDLIAKASQQDGGAHEDWELDKDYHFAKEGSGILIGGLSPMIRKFLGLGRCILSAGERVLGEIHSIRAAVK